MPYTDQGTIGTNLSGGLDNFQDEPGMRVIDAPLEIDSHLDDAEAGSLMGSDSPLTAEISRRKNKRMAWCCVCWSILIAGGLTVGLTAGLNKNSKDSMNSNDSSSTGQNSDPATMPTPAPVRQALPTHLTPSRPGQDVMPSTPIASPTEEPTFFDTFEPTFFDTNEPSFFDTDLDTGEPSFFDTNEPSFFDTGEPTFFATDEPTFFVTGEPTTT